MAASPHHHPARRTQQAGQAGEKGVMRQGRLGIAQRAAVPVGSVWEMLGSAFALLTCEPEPLAVDGAAVGHGLPARPIPLPELGALLLHPVTPEPARDAVWRHLAGAARDRGPAWVIGAAGAALPSLRSLAQGLARGLTSAHRGQLGRDVWGRDAGDVDAAVLVGFLDALADTAVTDTPGRAGVWPRLLWASYLAGLTVRHSPADAPAVCKAPVGRGGGHAARAACGDPEVVLARAVATGLLSPLQAELIALCRLRLLLLGDAAAEAGVGYRAAGAALRRGEARLVAAISSGGLARAPEQLGGLRRGASPAAAGMRDECDAGGGDKALGSSGYPRPCARDSGWEPECEQAGVRGRSSDPDGTSGSATGTDANEKGVFRSPARPPCDRPGTRSLPSRAARCRRHDTRGHDRRGEGGGRDEPL